MKWSRKTIENTPHRMEQKCHDTRTNGPQQHSTITTCSVCSISLLLSWFAKSQWTASHAYTMKSKHNTSHIIKLWSYGELQVREKKKSFEIDKKREKKMGEEYRAAGNAVHLRLVWAVVAVCCCCFSHTSSERLRLCIHLQHSVCGPDGRCEKVHHKVHAQLWRKIKLYLFRVSNM